MQEAEGKLFEISQQNMKKDYTHTKAVLPMAGRAAIIIRSEFCQPEVILSSFVKPLLDVDDLMQEAEGKLFEISQQNMKKDYTQINPVIDGILPAGSHLVQFRKTTLKATQTVGSCRSLLNQFVEARLLMKRWMWTT